jgi:hypothetical protein
LLQAVNAPSWREGIEQLLQSGPFHRGAGEPAIVITVRQAHPAFVFQRLFPERPTPERCVEAYYLQRTRFERVAERKLRRRLLTEDGNVEITGRESLPARGAAETRPCSRQPVLGDTIATKPTTRQLSAFGIMRSPQGRRASSNRGANAWRESPAQVGGTAVGNALFAPTAKRLPSCWSAGLRCVRGCASCAPSYRSSSPPVAAHDAGYRIVAPMD